MRGRAVGVSVTVVLCCLLAAAPPGPGGAPGEDLSVQQCEQISAAYASGLRDFDAGAYLEATESFRQALEVNPRDDVAVYYLAAAYAVSDTAALSLLWLNRLRELESCLRPTFPLFESLRASRGFPKVQRALEKCPTCRPRSDIAVRLAHDDVIPGSVAYDAVDRAFFFGDLRRGRIIRAAIQNDRTYSYRPFFEPGMTGLRVIAGMAVDSERRLLWVAASAGPGASGGDALFALDLESAEQVLWLAPESGEPRRLGGLALSPSGDVAAADGASGEIWLVRRDSRRLEVLSPAGVLRSPSGIAFSADGQRLFAADRSRPGIYWADLRDGMVQRLPHCTGPAPVGVEGLHFSEGSLIAVVPGMAGGRVLRMRLSRSLDRISAIDVMDCHHPPFVRPAAGALVGRDLYYLANTEYPALPAQGNPPARDTIRSYVVLKLRL